MKNELGIEEDEQGKYSLISFILENGKYIERNIDDYSNKINKANVIYATNLENDKVVLKTINLYSKNDIIKAKNEISFLLNLENRYYIVPISGIFVNNNILYIEMKTMELVIYFI